jgi:hypothetical protein
VMAMIAKKPDDRPATASAVARAASALRRGDVSAAAAAVPAIVAGSVAVDEVTQLLNPALATQEATRIMPTATAPAPIAAEEQKTRKRSRWTWPLVALIVVLALIIGGTVWAMVSNQEPSPAPSSSSTAPTPKPSSPSASPTSTTSSVVKSDFEGLDCDAASAKLDELELGADCVAGNAAPDGDSEGKIYDVNPTGNLPKGTVVTLTFYGPQTELPQPGAPGLPATVTSGSTVQVTWPGYSCPSGQGSPSSYNLTATQGVFPTNGQSSASFGSGDRSAQLQVTGAAGQTLVVTYTVTCSGGSAGQRTTAASGEAAVQIAAPSTPAPAPSNGADDDD